MTTTEGRWRDRVIAAAGLTAIWVLLWGSFSLLTVVAGALIATVVLIVFPLPPITFAGRVHPVGVLRLAGRFLADLVVASAQVAAMAFRFGTDPRSAVIAVPLRVPTDLGLTLTAEALSLVPGSLIVEVDRDRGILYVHVLGITDRADADRFRRTVLNLERRIILAFGSPSERTLVAATHPAAAASHPAAAASHSAAAASHSAAAASHSAAAASHPAAAASHPAAAASLPAAAASHPAAAASRPAAAASRPAAAEGDPGPAPASGVTPGSRAVPEADLPSGSGAAPSGPPVERHLTEEHS